MEVGEAGNDAAFNSKVLSPDSIHFPNVSAKKPVAPGRFIISIPNPLEVGIFIEIPS